MTKLSLLPGYAAVIDYDGRSVAEVLASLEYGDGLQITAFTATPPQVELGDADATVDLAWTIVGTVTGQTLTDSVAGGLALADPVADRSLADVSVASSRTFTLAAENTGAPGGTDSKSRQVNVPQLPRRYWGVADAEALDSAGVIALASSELSGGRAKSFTVDAGSGAGKFVYFAYLATLGNPAGYKLLAYDDDPVVTTVEVTTAAGLVANYKVLRSPNLLTGVVLAEIS